MTISQCGTCGIRSGMAFECVECCIRWLSGMDRETIALNAPVIEIVMGTEHMDKVRKAWKERK